MKYLAVIFSLITSVAQAYDYKCKLTMGSADSTPTDLTATYSENPEPEHEVEVGTAGVRVNLNIYPTGPQHAVVLNFKLLDGTHEAIAFSGVELPTQFFVGGVTSRLGPVTLNCEQ